ncbi:MAG: hypothetical protein AAGC66_13520 [Leifsonia sp.]
MLAAVGLLTGAELNDLIGQAVGQDRQSHPLSDVIGPSAATAVPAWQQWVTSGYGHSVAIWIAASVAADGLFVVAYAMILLRLVKRATPPAGSSSADGSGAPHAWTNFSLVFLQMLLVLEALEAVVLLMGAGVLASTRTASDVPPGLAVIGSVEAVIATAKWCAAALLVIAILRNPGTRGVLWRVIENAARAVWVHRLSAVLVLALLVFACIPAAGVLNQLPDIQRQWLDDLPRGALHYAGTAALTLAIAASGLFVLGRQRARCSYDFRVRQVPESKKLPLRRQWVWWSLPVAGWLVAAAWTLVVVAANGFSWAAAWSQFSWAALLFVGVPIVLVAGSWALDRYRTPVDVSVEPDPVRSVYAWLLGDVLAVMALCVGGLGLVRSFTAPVFLTGSGWAISLLLVGGISAVLWPWAIVWTTGERVPRPSGFWRRLWWRPSEALAVLNGRLDPTADRTPRQASRNRWILFAIIMGGAAVLAWALVFPMNFAWLFGGVGVTVLLISAWGAILGSFTVALQDFRLLAVFRVLRLKAVPVLTLAVVAPLVFTVAAASFWGGDPTEHAVRLGYDSASAALAPSAEPGLEAALRQRVADSSCSVTLPDGTTVKPVIVVAAQGGGIRAAYFTVKALSTLNDSGCLGDAVLMSSGISGGSLGLALTKTSNGNALDTVKAVAGPVVVASGVTGLLGGDLVAADLGVHVPSIVDGHALWRDRAALIEQSWMDASPSLRERFDTTPGVGTGYTFLNSTDARSKCRVIVGQLPLGATSMNGSDTSPITCARPDTAPAETAALSSIYADECPSSLDWAGAAMLSARFAVITPAGRLPSGGGCGSGKVTELIDGGYSEGSGLGTVADLAPTVVAAVRSYNQSHHDGPYALPLLLFLRNSSGFDLESREAGVVAEPLVPLEGVNASAAQSDQPALIQRIMANFARACPPDDADCRNQTGGFAEKFRSQAIVVSPFTRPTIAAPLGWALSDYSVNSLCDAVDEASSTRTGSRYAELNDLLGLVPGGGQIGARSCGR